MRTFIGIDGGGSQTQAVVVSESLEVLGRGLSGASNHYAVGAEQAAANCLRAGEAAILEARSHLPELEFGAIAAWGFGLAGVRRGSDAALVRRPLQAVAGGKPWVLDTDVAAAHAGAFAGGSGLVLSAGTGAICFGIDEGGERFYSDGWGPLLGDEGGGYWMGAEAMRAVCRAGDGRGPRTRLTVPVLAALGVPDCDELVRFVHSERCRRQDVAHLADIVLALANEGSQTAIAIRERAVAHLGQTAAAVARAMLQRTQARVAPQLPVPLDLVVALRGGLFDDDFFRGSVGYAIGESLIEMKRDFLPLASWRIVKPQFDAATGAALLARRLV